MSVLAPMLLGVSVTLLTVSLWPRRTTSRVEPRFIEDERVPRTLH